MSIFSRQYILLEEEALQAIEGTDYLSNEKADILSEYQKLIDMIPVNNMPRWIGPQPCLWIMVQWINCVKIILLPKKQMVRDV